MPLAARTVSSSATRASPDTPSPRLATALVCSTRPWAEYSAMSLRLSTPASMRFFRVMLLTASSVIEPSTRKKKSLPAGMSATSMLPPYTARLSQNSGTLEPLCAPMRTSPVPLTA